jgi:hypothetical protein
MTINQSLSCWEALLALQPRLAELEKAVRAADDGTGPAFCGVDAWHGVGGRRGFKLWLFRLVGYGADEPELRLREYYETATQYLLYEAMPPCRNCWCTASEIPEEAA